MKDQKFLLGIIAGAMIGLTVAGLQPLRAADNNAALLTEVQEIRKQMKTINGQLKEANDNLRNMGKDIKDFNKRQGLGTPPGVQ